MALLLAATVPDCGQAVTQMDMNRCAAMDYAAADTELNWQWALTSARMRAMDGPATAADGRLGYAAALLAAQRAWIAFRDAHCISAGYEARGGSMEPTLLSACKAALTRARTEQLADLAKEY